MTNRITITQDTEKEHAGNFEVEGYRSAVMSFLADNLGELPPGASSMNVHEGLKLIRRLIRQKARDRAAR